MGIQNVALVNAEGQVVNHVVVDTDDAEIVAALHEQWKTTRYVVTSETDVIILDPSPEIWTTHCDDPSCPKNGFNLPEEPQVVASPTYTPITINGREYPSDSLLIRENAHLRPAGYVLPAGEVEVSLSDAE